MFAKLSTAKTVTFGPVLDTAGAPYTGAIAYTDAKIWKNGTDGALDGSATFTHKFQGFYALVLTANDISAVGVIEVSLNLANYSAPAVKLDVLPAKVYDSIVAGSDNLEVDQVQLGGNTQSATDLKHFADSGYDPATGKVVGVVLVDGCTLTTTVTTLTNFSDSSGVTELLTRLPDVIPGTPGGLELKQHLYSGI